MPAHEILAFCSGIFSNLLHDFGQLLHLICLHPSDRFKGRGQKSCLGHSIHGDQPFQQATYSDHWIFCHSTPPHPAEAEAIEKVIGIVLWPRKTIIFQDRHMVHPGLFLDTTLQLVGVKGLEPSSGMGVTLTCRKKLRYELLSVQTILISTYPP